MLDVGLYSRSKLSPAVTRLWLVHFRSCVLHSCVEDHLEEQGNLFRAPYCMNKNIDIWGNISCLTHKSIKM